MAASATVASERAGGASLRTSIMTGVLLLGLAQAGKQAGPSGSNDL